MTFQLSWKNPKWPPQLQVILEVAPADMVWATNSIGWGAFFSICKYFNHIQRKKKIQAVFWVGSFPMLLGPQKYGLWGRTRDWTKWEGVSEWDSEPNSDGGMGWGGTQSVMGLWEAAWWAAALPAGGLRLLVRLTQRWDHIVPDWGEERVARGGEGDRPQQNKVATSTQRCIDEHVHLSGVCYSNSKKWAGQSKGIGYKSWQDH